ncbi:MAG: antiviral reverse transcriptase Drt3a [Verrucomicrobiaceae bacterium]
MPTFTEGYLRYLMRREDVREFHLGETPEQILARLTAAQNRLNTQDYAIELSPPFCPHTSSKDLLFKPARFEDKLYIRHLNRRLCTVYKVRHANRHAIVRQVKNLLTADAHLKIVRTDVRRFFRNIAFDRLLERLRVDGLLSSVELEALARIAHFVQHYQTKGVPWGLSISSTLAEIYLRGFDLAIRSTRQVYYYQRFVDDIVVFTTGEPQDVIGILSQNLASLDLRLNSDKTVVISESLSVAGQFSYLGYAFKRQPEYNNKGRFKDKEVDVSVTISEAKIERLEQRISESFSCFYSDRNWHNLRDRIRVLTGNYSITKSAHEAPIKTGIYFNYMEITDTSQLTRLDAFLRSRLLALRSYLVRHGCPSPSPRVREMFRYSFQHGFSSRVLHRISPQRISQIASIWSE